MGDMLTECFERTPQMGTPLYACSDNFNNLLIAIVNGINMSESSCNMDAYLNICWTIIVAYYLLNGLLRKTIVYFACTQ